MRWPKALCTALHRLWRICRGIVVGEWFGWSLVGRHRPLRRLALFLSVHPSDRTKGGDVSGVVSLADGWLPLFFAAASPSACDQFAYLCVRAYRTRTLLKYPRFCLVICYLRLSFVSRSRLAPTHKRHFIRAPIPSIYRCLRVHYVDGLSTSSLYAFALFTNQTSIVHINYILQFCLSF